MRDRKGFTLIELLIVVVIIGILAAIAIPKFAATRERAFISAMKSDLRNLANQQEIWYSNPVNQYTYSGDALALEWNLSANVEIVAALEGDENGYSVSVTHNGMPAGFICSLFYGDRTSPAPATGQLAGMVGCTNEVLN